MVYRELFMLVDSRYKLSVLLMLPNKKVQHLSLFMFSLSYLKHKKTFVWIRCFIYGTSKFSIVWFRHHHLGWASTIYTFNLGFWVSKILKNYSKYNQHVLRIIIILAQWTSHIVITVFETARHKRYCTQTSINRSLGEGQSPLKSRHLLKLN